MKYTCIKQHDITDCGAACLATISKHYGLKMPISKIREVAGTDKQGTNIAGMLKAAEKLRFTAKAVKGDHNAFFSEFPLPAIAHVIVDGALLHYVVIHKITKKQVIIADPAKGIVKTTPEEFFKEWSGVLILLVPSEQFEKKDETDSTLSRFFKLLLPQKKLLFDIFLASLVYTILGVGASFYFKVMMDDIVPNGLENTINDTTDGITTIIIAHRLSTIMKCDKIYVMDKSKIIESGNHFELMDKHGFYYELWKEQLPQENQINSTSQSILPIVCAVKIAKAKYSEKQAITQGKFISEAYLN